MTLPPPETMFEECERPRVRDHGERAAILAERPAAVLERWMSDRIDAEILAGLGPPNTSRSAAVALCRGLSTPGHYGVTPTITGPESDELSRLMREAGAWTLLQHAQYLATGHITVWRYVSWSAELNRATIEIVPPHETDACEHPADPRVPVIWKRLRCREITPIGGGEPVEVYCWDVWAIADEDEPDEAFPYPAPFFAVFEAKGNGEIGRDVTMEAVGTDALVGDAYPCRYEDGTPFLPVVADRFVDRGDLWGWTYGAGAFDATLDGMMLTTYAMRAALDATGDAYAAINCRPATTGNASKSTPSSAVPSAGIKPGGVVCFDQTEPGLSASIVPIGNGGHLAEIAEFADAYVRNISIDYGLTPADASRVGANPMSGLAIHLTNATKRQEQRRQQPLRLQSDTETIRKIVALARRAGATTATGEGFGVVYEPIEASAEEQAAEREQAQWEVAQGIKSKIDLYVEWNPGATREDAVRELARVAQDGREVARASGGDAPKEYTVGAQDGIAATLDAVSARTRSPEAAVRQLVSIYGVPETDAKTMVEAQAKMQPITTGNAA